VKTLENKGFLGMVFSFQKNIPMVFFTMVFSIGTCEQVIQAHSGTGSEEKTP